MTPADLKERIQPELAQDFQAVWEEWCLSVEHPDPIVFVEHLAEWGLLPPPLSSQLLGELSGVPGVAGTLDDISSEVDVEAATMHYARWTDETTPDPEAETIMGNPLLRTDDTSEEFDPESQTFVSAPKKPSSVTTQHLDTSGLQIPERSPVAAAPEPDLSLEVTDEVPATPPSHKRVRFRKVTGGLRPTGGWDDEPRRRAAHEPAVPEDPSGRYRFLSTAGVGAMGIVHLAQDGQLHRPVAYKVMSVDIADQPALASKFTAEVQTTAQLDHPGIVPVYTLEQDQAYTMKLVEGQTLAMLLEDAREALAAGRALPDDVSTEQLLRHLARVCDAVAYAHARGVVHRDLKPENIMVGAWGEVYVMDWGISKVFRTDVDRPMVVDPGEDEGDLVIGTPGYMSPEQADGRNDTLDGHSDQYALGLMLFELVTLAPALTAKTSRALVVRQQEGETDDMVHLFGHRIPRELRGIAKRALRASPAERYPTVAAMATDLRRYLAGEPVEASPDSLLQASARWMSRHRERALLLVLVGAFLSVTSVAALGALAAWQQTTAEAREQRLTSMLTTSARQSSLVESQFLRMEGLLAVVGTAAGEALRVSEPSEEEREEAPPEGIPPFEPAHFTDASMAPPDAVERADDARYGPGLVSVTEPVFVLAAEEATEARTLALADSTRRHFPRVLLRSHSEERAAVTPAMARQTILDREIPVTWAWIALEDGLYAGFPGHGGWPADFDPRQAPPYLRALDSAAPTWGPIALHPAKRAPVLTVSQALLSDQGDTLGVAGLDISLGWLLDKLLLPDGLRGVDGVEGLLLDDDGQVIANTSWVDRDFGSALTHRALRTPPYTVPEVVEAVSENRSGHLQGVDAQGEPLLVLYNRMSRVGWTHVIHGPPEALLGP